ncbi:short chain enoyl-CoA hydratase [Mariprofundus ferrinatatus]|uniref:enoyl-CoA hydratase n=1 Tax=Mariprofundus ferrinatatus TaxID=1921087 RepID=A0A2K8L5M0_9PROT|nr:3-hydroxyacyl-CoA dehydrogenase NAD-binding domain-containing protein [Mariprofundus ferrinatatus]ATX81539.1 short chain enoyl-CoA hydratase [Mariprofundus ferrinatatus]
MEVVTLIREGNEARLSFARSDKSVNVLDEACITQLEAHLASLEKTPPKVLVLESNMPGCFIAGADLDLIAAVSDQSEAMRLAERGQSLCRRIEVLPSVSIAMVNGACMGGGLEVALACDHIVAVEGKKTQLALPEIRIGIHPGFGGCVRLPKRVGWLKGVEMILTGSAVDAKRARRIGLAALSCQPEQQDDAIRYLATKGKVKNRRFTPWWLKLWPARQLFFRQVEKRAYARLKHLDVESAYPAVPAAISLLKEIIGISDGLALAREAESLGRLAVTPTCKNLIRVFHLGEALRKQESAVRGRDAVSGFRKAAVYGAGVMGGGIAWVASKTVAVDLHEVAEEPLSRGMKGIGRLATRRGSIDRKRLSRIRPVLDNSGLSDADVVIEAVLEDIKVKHKLWGEVGKHVPKRALLLSNTSSLSISDMQQRRANAGRIAGLHFFNPAPKMPLVEVIAGEKTTTETIDKTCALAASWGKYPIIVADRPGFLVNRCLMPFMVAALKLVESGQKPEHVDGALKNFGMPMGAIELADRVGLDICHHVGSHLGEALAAEQTGRFSMPAWFKRMVDDGLLGEKSGKGFFLYENGRQKGLNPQISSYLPAIKASEHEGDADITINGSPMKNSELTDACLIPMLIEALGCLSEQVVESPIHLEAAFIYGVGFPPFRGGLLRYFSGRDREELKVKVAQYGYVVPANLEVLDGFR